MRMLVHMETALGQEAPVEGHKSTDRLESKVSRFLEHERPEIGYHKPFVSVAIVGDSENVDDPRHKINAFGSHRIELREEVASELMLVYPDDIQNAVDQALKRGGAAAKSCARKFVDLSKVDENQRRVLLRKAVTDKDEYHYAEARLYRALRASDERK